MAWKEVTAVFDYENIWNAVSSVLLAIVGALARRLNAKDKTKLKWGIVLAELFIAAFTGIMTFKLARASGLTGDWVGIVCGIAGWTSPAILFVLTRSTEKILSLEENDLSKPKKMR